MRALPVTGSPTRRTVLAASVAAAGLLVTGCRGVQVLGTPPAPAPDITQLRAAIAAEQRLIASYQAAIAQADGGASRASAGSTGAGSTGAGSTGAGSTVAATLAGLLAEHEQHHAALSARLVEPPGYVRRAAPVTGLAPTISALAAAEQAAAGRLAAQLLTAPPSLAQLLASISASEATHVPVLAGLERLR
jgi:hypothetical protein